MSIVQFIPSKSHQWINYNINNFDIWIASDSSQSISENMAKQLINTKVINEILISNLRNKINNHFSIIVISKNWFLSAIDTYRSYPIYWHESNKIKKSLWASLIRLFLKIPFIFLGRPSWYKFDKKFISTWTYNLSGQCLLSYHKVIIKIKKPRNFALWHTLSSENKFLKSNW